MRYGTGQAHQKLILATEKKKLAAHKTTHTHAHNREADEKRQTRLCTQWQKSKMAQGKASQPTANALRRRTKQKEAEPLRVD